MSQSLEILTALREAERVRARPSVHRRVLEAAIRCCRESRIGGLLRRLAAGPPVEHACCT